MLWHSYQIILWSDLHKQIDVKFYSNYMEKLKNYRPVSGRCLVHELELQPIQHPDFS
jgi:hypothetical protein